MSECIEHPGYTHNSGYGRINLKSGKKLLAHRDAWIKVNGPIPDGMFVLHKCDNKTCVNPDHLFLGTLSENMQDCADKGRLRNQYLTD